MSKNKMPDISIEDIKIILEIVNGKRIFPYDNDILRIANFLAKAGWSFECDGDRKVVIVKRADPPLSRN
ncbi:MAG TPA: hypothetical protein PLE40_00870 [Candidatus Pacearchaeota archaeon]|nr:hypothetical protein [Candidatus Pacearchaeota archaeon]HOL90183.1 hypothetical protein [Candidatus Pacearchaeota archaeon]HPO68284.1 hypothetical protein [Candidatus Pacearchaeota archaeon]